MSRQRRLNLLNFCQKERLPIIEDDAYGQLWIDEKLPEAIKAQDRNRTVIYGYRFKDHGSGPEDRLGGRP